MTQGPTHRTGHFILKLPGQKACLRIQKNMEYLLIIFSLLLCISASRLILFLLLFGFIIKALKSPDLSDKSVQFFLSPRLFFFFCERFLQIQLRISQLFPFRFQLFHFFLLLFFMPDDLFLLYLTVFQLPFNLYSFFLQLLQLLVFLQLFLFFPDQKSQFLTSLICIFIFFRLFRCFLKFRKKFLKLFSGKLSFLFQASFLCGKIQHFFHCQDFPVHFLFLFPKFIFPAFSSVNKQLQELKTPFQLSFKFRFPEP